MTHTFPSVLTVHHLLGHKCNNPWGGQGLQKGGTNHIHGIRELTPFLKSEAFSHLGCISRDISFALRFKLWLCPLVSSCV